MRRSVISAQALLAACIGAAIMAGAVSVPRVLSPEAGAQPIAIQPPPGAPMSFADLIEKVEPAVVSVNVISTQEVSRLSGAEEFLEQFRGVPGLEEFFGQQLPRDQAPRSREARSLGSGFFISQDGLVVTNHHVIDRATQIQLVTHDGTELEAELVGSDRQTDLAVLRVKTKGTYPFVRFGSSKAVRKGDWVVALGNPFGLGGTATAGILSADGRELGAGSPYTDFLQIDAPINRGNSGGPTFDLQGNVIGVNSQILSPSGGSVGIGFAIPAELAQEITETLIREGRVSRGWLGVSISDLTPDFAEALGIPEAEGALIADVTPDSPADKGGLRRNDIILSVNGQKVLDATMTTRLVGRLIANTTNRFEILREGRRQTLSVLVGERPDDPYAAGNRGPSARPGQGPSDGTGKPGAFLEDFGARLVPMPEELRVRLGLRPEDTGLAITEITPEGLFAKAGLEPGIVILEANGRAVPDPEDFRAAVSDARAAGRTKMLLAVRVGQTTVYRTVDLPG